MRKAVLAALVVLSAGAAQADVVEISRPLAGATLNDAGIGMSVYWTEEADGGFNVVATYASLNGAYQPNRISMLLKDGDTVSFGLPERSDAYYTFERSGDMVRVSGESIRKMIAAR